MSNQWTKEQMSAISARGSNLLVAAAAGSGKTAVLVERIIRLITEDRVDIDSLLVVTFTNAAASEMRERIGEAIVKTLEENPLDRNLERQLALLNRSSITTIHSFCLEIIRNNFHLIDLDPGFRIADDTEASILREEALEEVLENAYESGDAGFLDLVGAYGGQKDDSQLQAIILGLYRFVMSDPWPEKWLAAKAEDYNIGDGKLQDMAMYTAVLREIRDIAMGYVQTMEDAITIIEDTPELSGYGKAFSEDLEDLRIFAHALEEGVDYTGLKSILDAKEWSRLGSVKKGGDKALAEEAKGVREDLTKFMKDTRAKYFNESEEDTLSMIRALYPLMKSLSGTTTDFIHEYDRRKRERGLLDFSDLEHLALRILTVEDEEGNVLPSPTALKYREKFHEVLVDEYQDSNEVQEVLISMVSRKEGDRPNVFMVGDVKQSIYRFRQAKPELFLAKYKSYDKEAGGHDRKILLFKNFRSKRNILDGVNLIFKGIMSSYVGELDYTDEEALIYGAEYYDLKESTEEPIELLLLESNGQDGGAEEENGNDSNGETSETGGDSGDGGDSGRVDLSDYKAIQLEARMVALKIKEIVQGKDGLKVYDRNLGDYRRISYRDIVVLMRATSASAPVFLAEFTDMEIPCFSDNNAGYFESTEVRTMVSLLRVIDNPLQDVPLISVLRSPVFSFSEEELAQIRIIDKQEFLYNNIVACAEDPEGYGAIHLKAVNFRDRMNVYRDLSL
ncbi:MAG TPA: helicase-exonuclease AddAB subunit AddA, partial [Clostridiaceae bacterium]|nr:helicase-exonuclease AddAB subunit AddA [Clostridiaceae bacterium]